jgi:hypothetical protein
MEVKKRKKEFQPYKLINNKYVTIMWDYKPILKINAKGDEIESPLAIWQEYTFKHIPTLSEIKDVIFKYYNEIIDKKILCGMSWKNMQVWLSTENQLNYKTAYDIAIQTNGKNLPVIFKFGDNEKQIFHEFNTIDELSDFYLTSIKYIQNTLQQGWEIKKSIKWDIFQ